MVKPVVLVNAGHRFTEDLPNLLEQQLTPRLATAYRDAFRASGLVCDWLQEVDGDNLPTFTRGSRHDAWRIGNRWIANHPGWVIVIDAHYQSGGNRGLFAIIPNRSTLQVGDDVRAPQGTGDHWRFNILDRRLGRKAINGMATLTGLPLCTVGVRENGLMDEVQTGVGADGYRLATFAWTSQYYDRTIRLVIEHGALDFAGDLAIIQQADFARKCAKAVTSAIHEVFPV